ncbi:MAG TPA: pyrroline-5-carboxylate reductase [Egibacteraceae bacterium]|nr:pyrroline-5-carboxylate reductase [Egibacteraceae bacterium]
MTAPDRPPRRIAIVGTGRMGEALLGGLLRSGWAPEQLWCTVRSEERARVLAETYGVRADTDSVAAAAGSGIVLLAVKPQNIRDVLEDIAAVVTSEQTVISVAAGVPTSTIEEVLTDGVPVVRVMSNVPVLVDEAMSAVSGGRYAEERHLEVAEEVLGQVGKVLRLSEEHLDSVTALSGSGPAYFFLLAEAMIDAGILLGLSRDVATELIIQTMVGSAKMLRDTGRHPVELRESVTSPGGTTIAAVRVLEQERVRAAFLNAIEAAKRRSEELAGA